MDIVDSGEREKDPFSFSWRQKVDLEGVVVLAFGGGGNLGETFLTAAAACGAVAVVSDLLPRSPEQREAVQQRISGIVRRLRSLNPEISGEWYSADVTSLADVSAVMEAVKKRYGRIDTVVDLAGVSHEPFDFYKQDSIEMVESFRRVCEINLTGAFIVTACAARIMIPQRFGQIIHLCSSGSRCSLYGSYAYNATKHGVEGLVKTAAAQLAPFRVRVNGVAPGTVETDLNRMLLRDGEGRYTPRALSILAHTPTKRFATREGVAETLIAMCLDQRHLTGNVWFVDDGYVVEGHSWPDGNLALYGGSEELESLFDRLDREYPRENASLNRIARGRRAGGPGDD